MFNAHLAHIGHLAHLGAVCVVSGIVEIVLDEGAVRFLIRRGDDLRQNELVGDGVSESIRRGPKFESVRKSPVKERVAVCIHVEEVHGTVSPRRVAPHEPGFRESRIRVLRGQVVGELHRGVHERLQGAAVHDVPGSNGRVAGIEVFLLQRNQVRFVEIESGEHNDWPKVGRGICGGIAGVTWEIGYIERAAIPSYGGFEGGEGRVIVGQVGRVDSQRGKDRSIINRVFEFPGPQCHVLRVY